MLIVNAYHLRQVLAEHETGDIDLIKHDRLGGLIHEYTQVA